MVRTVSFKELYGLVVLSHARRRQVRIAVTSNPTAEWIAGQVNEAFPWNEAPRYLIRDRDGAFGTAYIRRIRAMGVRDHPVVALSLLKIPSQAKPEVDGGAWGGYKQGPD